MQQDVAEPPSHTVEAVLQVFVQLVHIVEQQVPDPAVPVDETQTAENVVVEARVDSLAL